MNIKEFYKTAYLQAPPDLKHRQIKLYCGGGWVTLPTLTGKLIRTVEDLRPILVELEPTAVYISVSTFLHPELLASRKLKLSGYPHLSNSIINSDFLVDIDHSPNLLLDINRAYNYLTHNGFKEFKFVRTKRGAHIWVLDFFKKICTQKIPNPLIREFYIEQQRTILANELKHYEINFDYKVSVDTRRVARLWGSLHNDGFTVCKAYDTLTAFTRDYALHHKKTLSESEKTTHKVILRSMRH